jgi:hypothetical protein
VVELYTQQLVSIHKEIWSLEAELKTFNEQHLPLEEIGRRAILIRNWNAKRIEIKNKFAEAVNCIVKETKVSHLSQNNPTVAFLPKFNMTGNSIMYSKLFNFEKALAEYTGAPYVVATDGCTHAMELCLQYDQVKECSLSAYTYLSIPMLVHRLNISYTLTDEQWVGEYQLHGTRIWDSARRLERGMYRSGQMQCLSFGNTKPLQLGKGGAILLDDANAYKELSMMRGDGRDFNISPWPQQKIFKAGYHFCPTLELCELGTNLLPSINKAPEAVSYPDCRLLTIL